MILFIVNEHGHLLGRVHAVRARLIEVKLELSGVILKFSRETGKILGSQADRNPTPFRILPEDLARIEKETCHEQS